MALAPSRPRLFGGELMRVAAGVSGATTEACNLALALRVHCREAAARFFQGFLGHFNLRI
jgi:hypothetical protein